MPASTSTQVTEISAQASKMDWGELFSHIVPANIVDAFAKGAILQILFFSVLFAVGLKMLGDAGQSVLLTSEKINKVLFNVLKLIMRLSPIGAFGGMAYTIGKFGFATLAVLLKLLLTFYLTGLLFVLVVLGLV